MLSSSPNTPAQSKLEQMTFNQIDGDGAFSDAADKAPAAKRAKTAESSSWRKQKSPVKQTARKTKSLSLLLTMPLDVLFEIFERLNPRDILSLAKTSRIFKETLLSRGCITVWKAARERFDAPEPPSDMSEPAWAALLFVNVCQHCGAKNIQKVDFRLRRRLCKNCKKEHLILETRLCRRFPFLDWSILELLPYTNGMYVGGRSHRYSSRNRLFWAPDVEKMIEKVAAFKQGVDVCRPDAKRNLDIFKDEQKKLAETIRSAASGYAEWQENMALERREDKRALRDKRREDIYQRFMELGYEKEDISTLRFQPEFWTLTQLTDRIWQRIRPILEPKLLERKTARLERDLAVLAGAPTVTNVLFDPGFTYTIDGTMDDFDVAGLFRPDEDINFERDFGQWFNPDDVGTGSHTDLSWG